MSTLEIAQGIVERHVPKGARIDREALTADIRKAILDVANRELARVSRIEIPEGRQLAIASQVLELVSNIERAISSTEYPQQVAMMQEAKRRILATKLVDFKRHFRARLPIEPPRKIAGTKARKRA